MSIINCDKIDQKYICSICQSVYSNPVKIKNCEHIYCQDCLDRLISLAKEKKKSEFK